MKPTCRLQLPAQISSSLYQTTGAMAGKPSRLLIGAGTKSSGASSRISCPAPAPTHDSLYHTLLAD